MFVQGDAQALPFADESFDIVVSCETIEHVPDVASALREMWRVARSGGKLFLTTPNYANLMGLYELYARVRHPGRKDDQPFDRRQWFRQIRGYLRGAGWTILHSDGTVHQLPIVPGHNPVQLPFLESNRMIRRILSPFAYPYFLLAEKRGRWSEWPATPRTRHFSHTTAAPRLSRPAGLDSEKHQYTVESVKTAGRFKEADWPKAGPLPPVSRKCGF